MTAEHRKVTTRRRIIVVLSMLNAVVVACGGSGNGATGEGTPESLTIVAYDSFTPPDDAFATFTEDTGIDVEILRAGDAGTMVSKAVLTSGNPEGDVMWGVDNTLLQRAVDAGVFDPYVSTSVDLQPGLSGVSDIVTPVDYGDVCVNYDIAALDAAGLAPPRDFSDLTRPDYRGLLVVPDPTTSSTGLAFMLGTRAEFGDDWIDYWNDLFDNEVQIVTSWDDAYYAAFSRYGGDRPLVVSYASSPPAEVILAVPPLPDGAPSPTGVAVGTCFRQIEFAGVLSGTDYPDAARRLVDYLVDEEFQTMLPESIFVYPANRSVVLPESFRLHAPVIDDPLSLSPDEIAANRDTWLEEWGAVAR